MRSWWHGSPSRIPLGDMVVPGSKIGVDRYGMNRNRSVFVTTHRESAIYYGNSESTNDDSRDLFARYLYEVRPIYLYPDEGATTPHNRLVRGERQCRKAEVLQRWYCPEPNGTVRIQNEDGSYTIRWLGRDEAVYLPMDDE